MKNILLFGIQWAWKWTQASLILDKFADEYSYFEAGNILRALKSTDNALWNYMKKTIDKWNLVDDGIIVALLEAYFLTIEKWQSWLIDWFPRKLGQMYLFLSIIKRMDKDFSAILYDLSEEEAIKRLTWRRVCKSCGSIYNILIDPGLQSCKKCWSELIQRTDDTPEFIKQRIKLYWEETAPVISHFEKLWKLIKIDATKTSDEIFQLTTAAIKN